MLTTYSIKHIPKRMFQNTWNAFFLCFILCIGGGLPISYAAAPIAGSGTALDFDGVDDHVVITDYKGITGTQARTIEAWIKTTGSDLAIASWGKNRTAKKMGF
ncbi:secreted protein [Beggiatoa sp. PS]|nr:secreted protein [Beggiatoa sp. PS]